jgi:hypothetical protein
MKQQNFSEIENQTSDFNKLNDWELDGFTSEKEYQKYLDYQLMDIFINEILMYVRDLKSEYQQPFITILEDKLKYEL